METNVTSVTHQLGTLFMATSLIGGMTLTSAGLFVSILAGIASIYCFYTTSKKNNLIIKKLKREEQELFNLKSNINNEKDHPNDRK